MQYAYLSRLLLLAIKDFERRLFSTSPLPEKVSQWQTYISLIIATQRHLVDEYEESTVNR